MLSIERSGMTVGAFLKSISISFVFFTLKSRELSLHQLLNLSTTGKLTSSELERSSIAEFSKYFMICAVSVPVQSFVYGVKRIGDTTVPCGQPGGKRAGRRECSLVANCLGTIQRISLGLMLSFKTVLAMRCDCMALKTKEKSVNRIRTNKPIFSR